MEQEQMHNQLRIKKIKQVSFNLSEDSYKPEQLQKIRLNLNQILSASPADGLIKLTLSVEAFYEPAPKKILAQMAVENVFEVHGLNKLAKGKGLSLPSGLLIKIVDLSVSHLRALFATSLAGTLLQDIRIPIIDADLITQQLFGKFHPFDKHVEVYQHEG